jgi:hypothetical protein
LWSSPDIIRKVKSRRIKWVGYVACMEEMRSAYKISVGKPERKRLLRRPKHRCVNIIKMDLK